MFLKKDVKITPLGGVNMVGQNCFLYSSSDFGLVVDCGIKPQEWSSPPNLDILDNYLRSGKKITAVITHAHLDHIGAVGELCRRRIPIHLSKWSKNFMERYAQNLMIPVGAKFSIIQQGDSELTHGDFKIRFIPLKHSIPGTFGLLMKIHGKNILHLTDFKFNGMDDEIQQFEAALRAIKREAGDIHCLLLDVLNSDLEGFTPPESLVINEIEKMIKEANGRLIISFFSTNLFRMKGTIEAAQRAKKTVGFAGSMAISYHQIQKYLSRPLPVVPTQDCQILLVGGSQGEENSSLARMAMGKHNFLRLKRRDRVAISARCIPGNEEAVRNELERLNNQHIPITLHLGERKKIGLGFNVEERPIHVSGHGSKEDLAQVVDICNPKIIVPIHAPEERIDLFERMVGNSRVRRLNIGETLRI